MKTIELRRHSIKLGHGDSNLSEAGVQLALEVGRTQLRDKHFDALFVSALQRTKETLAAFAEGAQDFPDVAAEMFPPSKEVFMTDDAMALWDGACHRAETLGHDMMQAALVEDPSRARRIAAAAAKSFRRWVAALPDGAHVLVVNHSPALELITFGLFGDELKQLQPCEGFTVTERDGVLQTKPPLAG